ncbi:MAG: HDIG domain-containing protein, partial [Clostridia bacterium]|nr:HDIG domain-containing protein [Clostridia bacterium]
MLNKSKVLQPWKTSDYVRTILHFAIHALVLSALFLGAIFVNEGSIDGFVNHFTQFQPRMNYIYSVIAISFLLAMIYLYFHHEFRDFLKKGSNIFLVFCILEFSLILAFVIGKYVSIYARPFSLCALLILLLVNRRSAIIMNLAFCLITFMMDTFTGQDIVYDKAIFSSMMIGITTGLLAIYLVSSVYSRIKVFIRGIFISLPVIVCVLCFEYHEGMNVLPYIAYGLTSGMLSVVLMMAILPFFEYLFNVVTDYRLSELTDHNSKLIQTLREEAPGTFNHSLTVSTLAESCASAIGESPLLARAASYYHDIGKLKQPDYFTENQSGYNPHNELSPELSTDIIKAHTRDGYDLIRRYHLPQVLADVAVEHHGTLPIKYFYAKALKYTEGDLDIADFSYNGPKPTTKIAAIIMICDGSEAAVRSLSDRSQDKVDAVIKSIIEERMDLEQFTDCPLTTKDLDIIRMTISQSLGGVYHDRIKYPKLKVGRSKKS